MLVLIKKIYDGWEDSYEKIVCCSKLRSKIESLKESLEKHEITRRIQADECIECVFLDAVCDVKDNERFINRANKIKQCSGWYLENDKYLRCKNEIFDKYGIIEYEIEEISEI